MNSIHKAKNPLDFPKMDAFASLARTGSFSEVTLELFLTHSMASRAMSDREGQPGCRLMDRVGKRMRLTNKPSH